MNDGRRPFYEAMTLKGAVTALELVEQTGEIKRINLANVAGVSNMQTKSVLETLVAMRILDKGIIEKDKGYEPYFYKPGPLFDEAVGIKELVDNLEAEIDRLIIEKGEPGLVAVAS